MLESLLNLSMEIHDLSYKNYLIELFQRDFNTGVFLWMLRKFYEQPFLQNTSGDCFGQFDKVTAQ